MTITATVNTATLTGHEARPVTVTATVRPGLPSFTITDQPDGTCRETRDRIRAAFLSSGLAWPAQHVTVTMPDTRRPAASTDLAIGIAVAVATGQLDAGHIEHTAFLGELGLDGSIRRIPAAYALASAITAPTIIVPTANVPYVTVLNRQAVHSAPNLAALIDALRGTSPWPQQPTRHAAPAATPDMNRARALHAKYPNAARTLEIVAAGGHHMLMTGPSADHAALAPTLADLLPDLTDTEADDVLRIHSAAGIDHDTTPTRPPFRSVRPDVSAVALYGGSSTWCRPGEVSCAHHGVLYLDQLAEHSPSNLDALRQPLVDGAIVIERARITVRYPARFILIASSAACPCNNLASCRCSLPARQRYARRLNGPTIGRFDLRINVNEPYFTDDAPSTDADAIRARVASARTAAYARQGVLNSQLTPYGLDQHATLTRTSRTYMHDALRVDTTTVSRFEQIRRVARTIADLRGDTSTILKDDDVILADRLNRGPSNVDAVPTMAT